MTENHMTELCAAFGLDSIGSAFGGGHINDTFLAQKDGRTCVLQRINTEVFKNPGAVMDNILNVTSHLQKKIVEQGGNISRETLHFITTSEGKPYYIDKEGRCFRVYYFVDESESFEAITDPQKFFEVAKAFGRFQNMLSDFPAETLHETIAQFHDTPHRVDQLTLAINQNVFDRLQECEKEVEYALSQKDMVSLVSNALKDGSIPYRVTHNDTKLNNVLFDANTGLGLCVIDLDTVMPGSMLYDFGDALRYGANTAAEDETDLDKVSFDLTLFEAYTKGFASEVRDSITSKEKELLAFSAKLMTYECGIRFLADFLNGDTYFKTKYRTHNLDRAKNQFALCRDIDKKLDIMKKIVDENF